MLRDIKPPNSAGCLRSALLCQLDPADHRPPPHEQCGTRAVRTSTWRPRPVSRRSLWKGSVNTRTFGRWLARVIEMRTGQRPWADMQMQQIMMAVGVHQRTSQFVVRFLSRALSSLPLFFLCFSLPRAPPPLSHYLSLSPAHVCSLTNHHTRYVYRSSDVEGREADKKSAHHHLLLVKVLRGTPLKNQSGLETQALSLPSQSKLATVKARWARSTTPEGSYPHMMHCEPPFRSICWHKFSFPPFLDSPPVSLTEPVGSYAAPE